MHDDDELEAVVRTRKRAAAEPKRVRLTEAFIENGRERSYSMPGRLAAKTLDIQKKILGALEKHGPMSLFEIRDRLGSQREYGSLARQVFLLLHTEQIRAFIEIPSPGRERMAFILASKAPPNIWDRVPMKGYELENTRRLTPDGKPNPRLKVDARRQETTARIEMAEKMMDRAAKLPKRQEALALELIRQAKDLLEEK